MPSNVKLLAGASGGEPTDTNFKNVTLLLHGDGSNGAQNNTFLDSSTNNFTITRNGNTTQGSFSPYGSNWSNYFDGTGDYLTAPDNAALQLGSSNFTIEFWVNFSVVPGAAQGATLVSKFDTSNTGYEVILYNNTMYFQAQTASIGMTYAWTPTAGRWYHIAWTRSGSNSYGFIDGALVASTSGASGSITNLAQALQLGRRGDNTFYLNGYMSNVRVVKGTALYTAAFTSSTTPLTAITNTSLLTCQSNRFIDNSTNNFTITRNGDVKVTNFAPFAPSAAYSKTTNGGSSYYDGDTDYLSTSDNAAFVLNGTFTLEAWVYPTGDYSKYQCIITKRAGNTPAAWQLYINITDGYLGYYNGSGYNSTAQVPLNQWSHVAGVYDGANINLYLNGVRVLQSATTNTDQSTGVKVGYHFSSVAEPFKGYLADVRVVKGSQVYSGTTYTVPTAPLTAITNTSLLLNATNAAIFDNSMKNDLETVGNAQISTSVKKFGTGSMAFDGTGDYLDTATNQVLAFGTGDFTIEGWLYTNSTTGDRNLVDFRPTGTNGAYPNIFIAGGGYLSYSANASVPITGGTVIATGAWYHFALARSGTSTKLFLNGTQQGSTYTDSTNYVVGDGRPRIGAGGYGAGVANFSGYIDDLRITKGIARYTANFTAPTAPFPNK